MTDADAAVEILRRAAEDRSAHQHLGARVDAARTLVDARRAERDELQERLRVEEADVRRIEGISAARLWATLRGDAPEQAARERAERDAAALAVAGAEACLAQAGAELRRVSAQRAGLGDVEERYAGALAEYERIVTAGAAGDSLGTVASDLRIVAADIGRARSDLREVDEAVAALRAAMSALEEAHTRLQSAGGWSTYDTFFGGGMVADLMKHSRIEESADAFARVNRALERLRIELADVGVSPVQGVEISDTLGVFDVLFDNVFADWMVRERIAQAREQAVTLQVRLSELDVALANRRLETAERLAALARRREELLLTAAS